MDRNIVPPTGALSTPTTTRALVGGVRSWLGRGQGRSLKIELGHDTLELPGMSEDEQRRLTELWVRRHAEEAEAGHDVGKEPEPEAQGHETVEAEPVGEAEDAKATEPPTLTDEELSEVERLSSQAVRSYVVRPSSRVPAGGEAIGASIREAHSSLQVVTTQQAVKAGDDYASRLLKYIPTETVAAYLALSGVVASADGNRAVMLWAVFVFGLLLTPLYLRRVGNVHSWLQLGISTAAFVVWVFALGGPWSLLSWYEPYQGTLLLIAFTTTAPLVIPVPPSLKSAPAAG
jgi:hypothetical protein